MPAISVIVATYNRPHLLPRALDGLAEQRFDDFEVIVVNDAGVDPSPVVDRYRDRLDIRLLHNDRNLGVGPTQNVGFANAEGDFVCICSDDDRYLPNHLATLHEAALATPGTIPYTDGNQVIENEQGVVESRRHIAVPTRFDRELLLVENYLPSLSLLIPRAAIGRVGGFDPDLDVLEDWDLWIRLSAEYPFVHIPVVTFEYHLRGGGRNLTTREIWRFDRCLERVYDKHPVPPGSRLDRLRGEMLAGTAHRASEYRFDVSYVVAGGSDPETLVGALRDVVEHATGHSYEIVIVSPRVPAMERLAAQITGDVSFIFTTADDDLAQLADRRAAGKAIHVIDDLADLRLDEATRLLASA